MNRIRVYRELGGGPGILRYGVVLPVKALFWKSSCRFCGMRRATWRLLAHWQPMHIPGVTAHRGGSLCGPCHKRLCGRRHVKAACTKDLTGVA